MISKRRTIILSPLAAVALLFLCLFAAPSVAAETPSPSGVIRAFNAALLEAMKKADDLGYPGRYKLLDPVIRGTFALPFMTEQSTGRYWKTLRKDERETLVRIYTDWTVATYAGRFDGYSGEKFEIASEGRPQQDAVAVVSKLIKSNGEEVSFHYVMRRLGGAWRVVDIQISGVSQLALTRAQFTGVIRTKGTKGLISMLEEKIKGFEKGGRTM